MKRKKTNGYTLVEAIVAISIFTILATVVVFNLNQGRRNDDLRQAAAEFVLRLREIQSLAFNGYVSGDTVPSGYGLYLSGTCSGNCQYQTFLDLNGNLQYDVADQTIGQYRFTPAVALYKITLNDGPTSQSLPYSIVFRAPGPTLSYNALDNPELEFYMKHQETGRCRIVSVQGASGQIDEQAYVNAGELCF